MFILLLVALFNILEVIFRELQPSVRAVILQSSELKPSNQVCLAALYRVFLGEIYRRRVGSNSGSFSIINKQQIGIREADAKRQLGNKLLILLSDRKSVV